MFYSWSQGHTQLYWNIKDPADPANEQLQRQTNLNILFESVFGQKTDGTFVDIGCYDGINASMVVPLVELGWHGYFIDANPTHVTACMNNYAEYIGPTGSIEVIHSAIGAINTSAVNLYGDGIGATTNEDYRAAGQNIAWTGPLDFNRTVPQQTLDTFFTERRLSTNIELLCVDTEGSEPDIFSGFNLSTWAPKMLIVEMLDTHPDFADNPTISSNYNNLRTIILAAGYDVIYSDLFHTVYLYYTASGDGGGVGGGDR